MHECPACHRQLQGSLMWRTLFSGFVPHTCPACGATIRLTSFTRRTVAFYNVLLIIGFILVWVLPGVGRNLLVYLVLVAVVLWLMPRAARYETDPGDAS